jgi:uncharacterized damage-inducible protein DinB
MAMDLATAIIQSWRTTFEGQKKLAEGAIVQLDDDQLHAAPCSGLNSVAIIMQHMSGNMRSRFGPDWLEVDGERPGRDRDGEFVDQQLSRAALMEIWEEGWRLTFAAIDGLSAADLNRTLSIRGELHSVPLAVARQISHYAYHVGQIMMIARNLVGNERWQWQTITPRAARGHRS